MWETEKVSRVFMRINAYFEITHSFPKPFKKRVIECLRPIFERKGRPMPQILRRFFIFPVLVLALGACSTGPSSDYLKATRAAALTEMALPTETLPVPTETITLTPTGGTETSALSPTITRTATRPSVPAGPVCDNSAYISDVTIPDGTVMQPEEVFVKTWSLRNTGTCGWTTAYAIDFVSGKAMDGVITYMPQAVDPGGTVEISVGLAAPSTPGTYIGYWRLKNADGTFFGDLVYVQIVVPGSGGTSEPTAEITDTLEPTAEITNTLEPTEGTSEM
jgi:hypothetical protein